jgi:hypothetical protein
MPRVLSGFQLRNPISAKTPHGNGNVTNDITVVDGCEFGPWLMSLRYG